jgi:filamentous hemagglutinin
VGADVYPNRGDDKYVPVPKFSIMHDGNRWKTVSSNNSKFTARGLHIFVVQNGEIVISKRRVIRDTGLTVNHIDLACGGNVEFAGEVRFSERGILKHWNDKSGHYHNSSLPMKPDSVGSFPVDRFRPYKEVS